ncbi:uncharacterized protein LOC133361188 [Lethenteron reissneri]|uniref:uncharacterized protein LOC133361188 n=1 Tax=Lethenteron reissneri TaxID=7753 RepID=UPI002AB6E08A|nr:uncharacterized protein LOC133361188 [Lethenteron reissneri]
MFAPELQEGQPVTFSVLEKGAALLKIETRANPPEVTVEWSRAGQILVKKGVARYVLKEGGSLEVWNVTRADAGDYDAAMTNAEGTGRATLRLDVHCGVPPSENPQQVGSELYSDITGGRSSTLTTQETLSCTDSYYSTAESWAEQHLYEEATDTSAPSDTAARPLYQRAPRRAELLPVEPIEEEPLDFDDDEEMEDVGVSRNRTLPFEMRGDLV